MVWLDAILVFEFVFRALSLYSCVCSYDGLLADLYVFSSSYVVLGFFTLSTVPCAFCVFCLCLGLDMLYMFVSMRRVNCMDVSYTDSGIHGQSRWCMLVSTTSVLVVYIEICRLDPWPSMKSHSKYYYWETVRAVVEYVFIIQRPRKVLFVLLDCQFEDFYQTISTLNGLYWSWWDTFYCNFRIR